MPNPLITKTAGRIPGLRRLPMAKVLLVGELALLAREHVTRLEPYERRRLFELLRRARMRRDNLTAGERAELAAIVAKTNPRLFVGSAADKLSPVRLPRRVL
ncbi:MAG TPA: hypothetical protein VMU39_12850, partial [Solirubrobacteraceae bacterium]|nr:hypothetical protein [Solirubrobacteraceae bacterium]